MEGIERAQSHRTGGGGGGGEFFICFTARPSSSASSTMRVPSSKSLMSPGRGGRDNAAPSLSASLSRRLRSSGSVKGGQSPMFPAGVSAAGGGGRRKGCAFEAAEPSSPKVTCIGQVRVKSKKKKKGKGKGIAVVRSRSQRSGGEASFRRHPVEQDKECLPSSKNHQSWVYQLPVSICDALRALGSEFSCLLPCGGRSPCSSSSSSRAGEDKGGRGKQSRSTSSCAAVLARWLMAIQDDKRGEVVELVVEEREKGEVGFLIRERQKGEVGFLMREREKGFLVREREKGDAGGMGMEEMESVAVMEKNEEVVVVEEEGRVSVCIPPRNALLLMRCRSDPVRVAALADRFWGSPDAAKVPCQEHSRREAIEEDDLQQHTDDEEEEAADDFTEEAQVAHSETEEEHTAADRTHEEVASALEEEINVGDEKRQQLHPDVEEEKVAISTGGETGERQMWEDSRDEPQAVERVEEGEEVEMEGGRPSSCSTSRSKEERRSSVYAASSKTKEWARRRSCSYREKEKRRNSFSSGEKEARRHSFSTEREARRASFSVDRGGRTRWSFSLGKEERIPKDKDITTAEEAEAKERSGREEMQIDAEANLAKEEENSMAKEDHDAAVVLPAAAGGGGGGEERDGEVGSTRVDEKSRELPDCLLMMMYEPKLSMEVSRETWVCSNDFIRWRPHHTHRPQPTTTTTTTADGGGANAAVKGDSNSDSKNKEAAVASAQPAVEIPPPPRPTHPSPAPSSIEEKLKASAAVVAPSYGPLVLTRCKSEPMRSSARLAPDACFWKNRHQPIGAAGIGF